MSWKTLMVLSPHLCARCQVRYFIFTIVYIRFFASLHMQHLFLSTTTVPRPFRKAGRLISRDHLSPWTVHIQSLCSPLFVHLVERFYGVLPSLYTPETFVHLLSATSPLTTSTVQLSNHLTDMTLNSRSFSSHRFYNRSSPSSSERVPLSFEPHVPA